MIAARRPVGHAVRGVPRPRSGYVRRPWSRAVQHPPGHARRRRGHPGHLQPRGRDARRPRSTWSRGRSAEQRAWLGDRSGAFSAVVADARRRGGRASPPCRRTRSGPPTAPRSRTRSTCAATSTAGASAGPCSSACSTWPPRSGFHAVMARIEAGGDGVAGPARRAAGSSWSGIEREVGRKFNRWLDVARDAVPAARALERGPVGA